MKTFKQFSLCPTCDEWYHKDNWRLHEHKLPQSGDLRERWLASGMAWRDYHDVDPEAREWGHREAKS